MTKSKIQDKSSTPMNEWWMGMSSHGGGQKMTHGSRGSGGTLLLYAVCALVLFCHLYFWTSCLFAEELDLKKAKQIEALILSSPNNKEAATSLEDLSRLYLPQHKYNQFIEFLKKLEQKKATDCSLACSYYIALCRHEQLKYLEGINDWQEYFDSGNSYRQEIFQATEKLIKQCPLSEFSLRAQLINWQLHLAQNDAQVDSSLDKLMDMANSYATAASADLSRIDAIKEIADSLSREGQAAKARVVYGLYVTRLTASHAQDGKLKLYAEAAFSEGNTELSRIIYERYLEIIKAAYTKDNLAKELILIARNFADNGWEKGRDSLFAEVAFKSLEELCGKAYFDVELQYLRAYNLQRMKDYPACLKEYETLARDFPDTGYIDEAEFKLGIISIYVLGDEEKGLAYLEKIVGRNSKREYVAESLYHKSLLSHYRKDSEKAMAGYVKILDLINHENAFQDLAARVEARKKEIGENQEIEHNLKTFLDGALVASSSRKDTLEVLVSSPKAVKASRLEFFTQEGFGDYTGCLSPELSYLWSGELGSISPIPVGAKFSTEYKTPGTKIVNLVVLSPVGLVDETIEIADVYSQR